MKATKTIKRKDPGLGKKGAGTLSILLLGASFAVVGYSQGTYRADTEV